LQHSLADAKIEGRVSRTSGTDSAIAFDSAYSRGYVLYAIALIFLVSVFNVTDRYILAILAPALQADLALDDSQMGLLLGPSFSTVHFLAVLPAAWLADRHARRTVVAIGLFVWSGMTALGGMSQSFVHIFLARMGVGIGEAAGSPPSAALLSDTAPVAWRARALAAITVGALVGAAAGMLLGGLLGQEFGWRFTLIVLGLPGVLLALLVRFTLREPTRSAGRGVSPGRAARHLFGFASFRWAVAAACISNVALAARSLWEPTFLIRTYDLSMAQVGLVYVLIGALPSAAGAFAGAAVADRLGARDPRWLAWVCTLSNLLAAPFLIAFLLWPESHVVELLGLEIPVAFAFSLVGSLFIGFFSPPMGALAQALATDRIRSLAHAIWTMPFTLIGMGLGPYLVGVFSDQWSDRHGTDALRYGLAAVSALLPVGAMAFLVAARTLREDIAAAAALRR
jgi:MFS family permease